MTRGLPQLQPHALREVLRRLSAPADPALVQTEEGLAVRCFACGHRCLVREGKEGICKVRYNEQGTLRVPFGYVAGLACDPIEKKPFNHVLPGSNVITFGMLGCDFHCGYCQNWGDQPGPAGSKRGRGRARDLGRRDRGDCQEVQSAGGRVEL